jgi:hypothetical protein
VIPAHRVDGDLKYFVRLERHLFVPGADDGLSFVVSALDANAMRFFVGSALSALGGGIGLDDVVRAPLARALVGVSAFWIGHCIFLLLQ